LGDARTGSAVAEVDEVTSRLRGSQKLVVGSRETSREYGDGDGDCESEGQEAVESSVEDRETDGNLYAGCD
jgi:hypothetical protein